MKADVIELYTKALAYSLSTIEGVLENQIICKEDGRLLNDLVLADLKEIKKIKSKIDKILNEKPTPIPPYGNLYNLTRKGK